MRARDNFDLEYMYLFYLVVQLCDVEPSTLMHSFHGPNTYGDLVLLTYQ